MNNFENTKMVDAGPEVWSKKMDTIISADDAKFIKDCAQEVIDSTSVKCPLRKIEIYQYFLHFFMEGLQE